MAGSLPPTGIVRIPLPVIVAGTRWLLEWRNFQEDKVPVERLAAPVFRLVVLAGKTKERGQNC